MIVRPAVDIREGQCVQLIGGSYDDELLRLPDPVAVAQDWIDKGFSHVHVIDLDRATERGSNVETVQAIASLSGIDNLRVGGGIRSEDDINEILSFGANSVVVGTTAVQNPDWFLECATKNPGKLLVALEVNDRDIMIKGWQEKSEHTLESLIALFTQEVVEGIFVTAIHKEGRRAGTDIELFEAIRSLTYLPIIASGGVTTMDDIAALEAVGIDEVVLGAAIYTDPELVNQLQETQLNGRN